MDLSLLSNHVFIVDTKQERTYLSEKIVPELREQFYDNYGIEFQVRFDSLDLKYAK